MRQIGAENTVPMGLRLTGELGADRQCGSVARGQVVGQRLIGIAGDLHVGAVLVAGNPHSGADHGARNRQPALGARMADLAERGAVAAFFAGHILRTGQRLVAPGLGAGDGAAAGIAEPGHSGLVHRSGHGRYLDRILQAALTQRPRRHCRFLGRGLHWLCRYRRGQRGVPEPGANPFLRRRQGCLSLRQGTPARHRRRSPALRQPDGWDRRSGRGRNRRRRRPAALGVATIVVKVVAHRSQTRLAPRHRPAALNRCLSTRRLCHGLRQGNFDLGSRRSGNRQGSNRFLVRQSRIAKSGAHPLGRLRQGSLALRQHAPPQHGGLAPRHPFE